MFDERAFITRVESANTDELVRLLIAPTAQEEKAFRAYFGDELYQRLRLMALKSSFRRGERDTKGNVVVIHGIMGSELTAINRAGAGEELWLKVLRIINGKLDLLRLGDDGRTEYNPDYDIRASGILKRYYGKLLLSLSESWNVRAFWFDWRKDLKLAADELQAQISGWFGDDAPVHIVAHSMGGLVARTFIKKHPQRWEAMWDKQFNGKAGGRLIMLGTPNHGSFDIPQVITGLQKTVRKLNLIDIRHRLTDLLTILNSFVGSYQMLPSPFVMESMEPLYKSESYGDLQVPQRHLDNAWQHHKWLSDVVDTERMIYIAGYNQPTFSNINDLTQLKSIDAYEVTMDGDGNVPHTLGLLTTPDGREIKTYYIQEKHGSLPANRHVLSALNELLEEGTTEELNDKMVSRRSIQEDEVRKQEVLEQLVAAQTADEERLLTFVRHASTRSAEPISIPYLTSEERKAIAQLNLTTPGSSNPNRDKRQALEYFLGTSRGFTRQLRTTFAPPPEPTLPPRRILRVLVVADPAQDAHLPGAEQEGFELTNLFEEFNTVYNWSDNRVEVVGLFGPREATRTNVLRHLMLHSYDVLHFAGHCIYNKDDPASSGWIFANGECLGVNELNRIDRIPHFVFSNACESGITPDRSEERSVELAPSFAEAFFTRGVSNFVCTAWPVYDSAALQFALRLYSGLLGLRKVENQVDRYTRTNLEPMYIAMREARRAIAETTHDVRTWGAYQHYGNPFFRFFNETTMNL